MGPKDDALVENRRLRRTMRDLVALSALPAIWTGQGQEGIASSLAEALLGMLSLDLVYVRFAGRAEHDQVEVLRTSHPGDDSAAMLRTAIVPLLDRDGTEPPAAI